VKKVETAKEGEMNAGDDDNLNADVFIFFVTKRVSTNCTDDCIEPSAAKGETQITCSRLIVLR
jgi:hypothetical protein